MPAMPTDPAALSLSLRVLSSDFRLEFDRPESRARMARLWSRCVAETGGSVDARVVRVDQPDTALSEARIVTIGAVITETAIAEYAGGGLLLRAQAVAHDDGRVWAIVGARGRPVQKAVIELAGSEMTYVASGVLAITADGHVASCPQPLRVNGDATTESVDDEASASDAPALRTVVRGPDDLALRRCPQRLVLDRIVLVDAVDDPPTPSATAERLTLAEALMSLAPYVASFPTGDGPLRVVCRLLEACGGIRRLVIGPEEDHLADVLRALPEDSEGPDTAAWAPIDAREAASNPMLWRLRDGRVRPAPSRDAVGVAGEAVILVGSHPVRLSPLGFTLWCHAAGGATFEALEAAAVAAHGWHPDATALVRDALGAMRDAGAVSWGPPLTVDDVLAGRAEM